MKKSKTKSGESITGILRSDRGSVLLQAVLFISILMTFSLSAGNGILEAIKYKHTMKARKALSSLRSNVLSDVFGASGWNLIITDILKKMEEFHDKQEHLADCPLDTSQDCIIARNQPLVWTKAGVSASDGTSLVDYNPSLPSSGFTLDGKICNSFSSSGNDECPIHLDLTWQGTCLAAGQCLEPYVILTAKFRFSGGNVYSVAINASHYDVQFRR